MKLVVLIPSAAYAESAGVRIRYARLVCPLGPLGIELETISIDSFDPNTAVCDGAILSKCHDARALVIAALLSRRAIPVGVDLFDDYFSQSDDSRLGRFRSWFTQAMQFVSFVLCSTEVMAKVVRTYAPGVPLHILSDPAPEFDEAVLSQTLARKLSAFHSDGVLRACWFGIGDNPYFPVGLSDLLSFSSELRSLVSDGVPIEFTVLTNARALDASGLARIARLPISATVEQWSLEREAQLLRRCMLAFLPVNAQPFSRAKSLNRAVTALTSGCQVLSAGYPLYAPLDSFIYRESGNFLRDLSCANLKLSKSTVRDLSLKLEEIASPEREARSLAQLLGEVRSSARRDHSSEAIYVLHGFGTNPSVNDLLKKGAGISVRSPFCAGPIDCEVLVNLTASGEPTFLVSDNARSRLSGSRRKEAASKQRIGGRKFWKIAPDDGSVPDEATISPSLALQLARYGAVMRRLMELLPSLFGQGQTIVSENSPLPVEVR